MYICENCKHTFDEYATVQQLQPWGDTVAYEQLSACPHCKSEEIEEADTCADCSDIFAAAELTEGVCWKCVRNQRAELRHIVKEGYIARYGLVEGLRQLAMADRAMEGESIYPEAHLKDKGAA